MLGKSANLQSDATHADVGDISLLTALMPEGRPVAAGEPLLRQVKAVLGSMTIKLWEQI
jgi:hypothetical protein